LLPFSAARIIAVDPTLTRCLADDKAASAVACMLGQLPIMSVERAAKLLVTAFAQSVIPTTRLQAIEVFRHPMHHHLPSHVSLCQSHGFHARKHAVTTLGDDSEIAESIKQHDWLFQAGLPT
jgi:hypothetical protein